MWTLGIGAAKRYTHGGFRGPLARLTQRGGPSVLQDEPMIRRLTRPFARSPERLVRTGLWMFFAGALALLCSAVAQVASAGQSGAALAARYPSLPTWFVPESAVGFTAAASLVCWGVWAMGAGLRMARDRRSR